ncbi:MAG: class I SAM-dependent methyltransferase [Bdellovibrionota bacterium]
MPKAAQHFPLETDFGVDQGIALTIRQCEGCALVQLDGEPVSYFKDVITAASLSEKSRSSRLAQMRDFAVKFQLTGKSVLDVGAAKGEMLEVLTEAGFGPTGLEASSESVAIGKSAGRNMAQGFIGEGVEVPGSPFEAFISLNYLEHLPEPGVAIRRISALTTPDAAGFVTVPNLEYLLATRCFYEFVADHLSYFTKKTLSHAFESNGFDIIDCQTINEDNDIRALVKKRRPLDLSSQYGGVLDLIADLRRIIRERRARNKKVAVWGAGHRTLALLSLGGIRDLEYVVDSAKFKQGRFTPVTHVRIVGPERLLVEPVDLVIVMVPGLYPSEVLKTLEQMAGCGEVAILKGEKFEFLKASTEGSR